MPEPVPSSALGPAAPRRVLPEGVNEPGVTIRELPVGALWQVTAWPDALGTAGAVAAAAAGVSAAPGPCLAVEGDGAVLARVQPLAWWLIADGALPRPELPAEAGTLLDLGHARTRLRLAGPAAPALLARLLPVDCRPARFPPGSVATTPLHHIAVTLVARADGIDLLLPRSFAWSLHAHLVEIAEQFGLEIA